MSRRVPDRKRQRREYLKTKGQAYTFQAVGNLIFIPSMIVAVICILASVFYSYMFYVVSDWDLRYDMSTRLWFLKIGVAAGLMAFASWRMLRTGEKLAKVAYVPRIRTETLPAVEVLVRGAEQPTAASETLVRATQAGGDVKTEELLRSKV